MQENGDTTSRLETIVNAISEKHNLKAEIVKDGPFTAWINSDRLFVSKNGIDRLLKGVNNKSVKGLIYREAGKGLLSNLGITYVINNGDFKIKGFIDKPSEQLLLGHIYNRLESIRIEESITKMYEGVNSELLDYAESVDVPNYKRLEQAGDGGQLMAAAHLITRYPDLANHVVPDDIKKLVDKILPYAKKSQEADCSEDVLKNSIEVYKIIKEICEPENRPKSISKGNLKFDGEELLPEGVGKDDKNGKDIGSEEIGETVDRSRTTFKESLKSAIANSQLSRSMIIPKELKIPKGGTQIYNIPAHDNDKEVTSEDLDMPLFTHHKQGITGMISTLAKKIKDAFILKNKTRFLGGFTSGKKLDGMTFSRILNDDDRLFMQKDKEQKPSVAITLLLDLSGSMGHKSQDKIQLVSKSTIIFSEVLTKLHIPFEILAFTTYSGCSSPDDVRGDYLYHIKIKEYDEPYTNTVKARIGGITGHGNNLDAEALLWAYKRIKLRQERDRLILVLSDGMPSGAVNSNLHMNFLTNLSKAITKAGVTVIGIGYLNRGVERFYKQHILITDINELPRTFLKLLNKIVIKEKQNA